MENFEGYKTLSPFTLLVFGKVRIGIQAVWPLNLCFAQLPSSNAQRLGWGFSFGDEAGHCIILCQAGLPIELSGVERFIAILGSTNEAPLDLLDYNKVLVLIHLIRWHAFIGYVLFFFNLEYQAALERMIPRFLLS